jgi:hypothetical protein
MPYSLPIPPEMTLRPVLILVLSKATPYPFVLNKHSTRIWYALEMTDTP